MSSDNAAEGSRQAVTEGVVRKDSIWRLVLLGVPHQVIACLAQSKFEITLLEDLVTLNWEQVHTIRGLKEEDHNTLYDALMNYDRLGVILAAIEAGKADNASFADLEYLGASQRSMEIIGKKLETGTLAEFDAIPPMEIRGVKNMGDVETEKLYRALARYPRLPVVMHGRKRSVQAKAKKVNYVSNTQRANLWELQNPRAGRYAPVQDAAKKS